MKDENDKHEIEKTDAADWYILILAFVIAWFL